MQQAVVHKGKVTTIDVPQPVVSPGWVLIKVMDSCISTGTELSSVKGSGESLVRKALRQPEKVRQFFDAIGTLGLAQTLKLLQSKLGAYNPIGYSVAGVVVGVGDGVHDVRTGDRVAAGGAGLATHAEFVEVPRNLVTRIPGEVSFKAASTTTIGSIALQGIRRADLRLGETVVVFGLGVLGQLAVQLAKAAGCRVIGVDLDDHRLALASEHGADHVFSGRDERLVDNVVGICSGQGADAVVFTAATSRNEPLSQAFQMTRRKGKVVLVGVAGPEVRRSDIYEKEIDFLVSCSYGPGRYDPEYELRGKDYPFGYVRWTENRNMQAYLHLLQDKHITLETIIEAVYPINDVERAYESLQSDRRPLMVVLEYNQDVPAELMPEPQRIAIRPSIRTKDKGIVNVGVIGVGGFATAMHLPNLTRLSDRFQIRALADKLPAHARSVAERYHTAYCASDYRQILDDADVDLVMICTRHHLHGPMVLESLQAGKHVFVEKPLAIKRDQLEQIKAFYDEKDQGEASPVLLTGFNRRFSPYAKRIREDLRGRVDAMIINYRMNAGYFSLDHWVHTDEGGGRNVGEACHIYDLFTYFTDSDVIAVKVQAIDPQTARYTHRDNFVATVAFADGSVGTLTYTALGAKDHPKEQMELFVDGKVYALNDYKRLTVAGAARDELTSKMPDKGHADELAALGNCIRRGGDWPIPLWQQLQAMETAFAVDDQLTKII